MTLTERLPPGDADLELWLDFDARQKRRQLITVDALDLKVALDRLDTPLHDGERLAGDGLTVRIRAKPERLVEARGRKGLGVGQAAVFFNRAMKVSIGFSALKRCMITYCWAIDRMLFHAQ